MPELPEVETSRRGIEPHIRGETIKNIVVRETRLRWPVDRQALENLKGKTIQQVLRRGKYLRLILPNQEIMIHLGMSGSLRVLSEATEPGKHDHLDIAFGNGRILRFNDPRRFGSVICHQEGLQHPLLASLGPEPLSDEFNIEYFARKLKARKGAIKAAIMDSKLVVGVGNIYAQEALFESGIHPQRAANRISNARLQYLLQAIRKTLQAAIQAGGSSLKDFTQANGKPGYFQHQHLVYGRGGQPCVKCQKPLKQQMIAQRTTCWCSHCQR